VITERHFERAIATGIFPGPRSFRRHYRCPVVCARA
jgi:hypothetical protein